jgi:hypothetical protein
MLCYLNILFAFALKQRYLPEGKPVATSQLKEVKVKMVVVSDGMAKGPSSSFDDTGGVEIAGRDPVGGPRRALPTGCPPTGAVSEPRGGHCGVEGHRAARTLLFAGCP